MEHPCSAPPWPSSLPPPEALGFGAYLGAQVVIAEHDEHRGWSSPQLLPREQARLDLASGGLQYGLSVFEGLKAYRAADGSVHLFRPLEHAARLDASARRLALPSVPTVLLMDLACRAVQAHRDWLPPHRRGSLYLRPTLYAIDEGLGLRPSRRHALSIVVTPCSAPAFSAKRLWAERDMIRAAAGGLGAAKTGANYAASVYGAQLARARGYDDVLWLDAPQRRYLGEAGTMNVFVVAGGQVLTPPLDGSILAGITRDSLLHLLREEFGIRPRERPIALDELEHWSRRGELQELFGAGTAARVAPITEVAWQGASLVPAGGELAARLSARLAEVQDGVGPDRYGWRRPVQAI